MLFNQLSNILPQVMPNLEPGFHELNLPTELWDNLLEADASLSHMIRWIDTQAKLDRYSFTVMVGKDGTAKLATPGIWLLDHEPIMLFGFKNNAPVYGTLDGLSLVRDKGSLYTVTLDDIEFPIKVRLQTETDPSDLPALLSPAKIKTLAKPLSTSKTADWVKFRDVIDVGDSLVVEVTGSELKTITKNGKSYYVYLLYTDLHTFSVSEKHYDLVVSLQAYRLMTGDTDTPLYLRIQQEGFFNGHKVFKLSYTDTRD